MQSIGIPVNVNEASCSVLTETGTSCVNPTDAGAALSLRGRVCCRGEQHAKHTHTDTHMHQVEIGPKRGKERYAHCAAGICDDRKAADSETQERRRRRSVQQKIHSG